MRNEGLVDNVYVRGQQVDNHAPGTSARLGLVLYNRPRHRSRHSIVINIIGQDIGLGIILSIVLLYI